MKDHSRAYLDKLKSTIDNLDTKKIDLLKAKIQQAFFDEKTIFICGNGGSATTASHMACDLSKTILGKAPREATNRARAISLNDNIALMTAWANDEGYEHIFSEQLKNIGSNGDLLIIITGSGNSSNILEVIVTAQKMGIKTFGLLGFAGGKAKDMLQDFILVNSHDYGIVEDTHHILNHLITDFLKNIPIILSE